MSEAEFEKATSMVKQMKGLVPEERLEIYSLCKQAAMGDCKIACPSATLLKGKGKWDAWKKQKGQSKVEAMKASIGRAEAL